MRRKRPSEKLSRAPRLRLIPLVMVMGGLLFIIKAVDVYQGTQKISALFASNALAEDEAPEAAETQAEAEDAKATEEEKPAEDKEEAEAATEEAPKEADKKKEEPYTPPAQRDRQPYSQVELDILQSLSARREELDARERGIDMKEKVLGATEQRINGKIEEIKGLKAHVEGLLKQYQGEEESHLKSLVKIYENMKPKDAAQIFNEMNIEILIDVIDRMSERKVASILAGMSPTKANEVTEALAEKRRLQPTRDALKGM